MSLEPKVDRRSPSRRARPSDAGASSAPNRSLPALRPAWLVVFSTAIVLLVAGNLVVRHYTRRAYVEARVAQVFGPRYLVHIGSSHYDPFRSRFEATDISIRPDTLRPPPPNGFGRGFSFRLAFLRATGINLLALWRGNIDADEIVVEEPRARLFVDRRELPLSRSRPRQMPHERLMSSRAHIRIGAIRIHDGELDYSERAVDGARPGTFRFANLDATVLGLSNDARAKEPCKVTVETRLADSGQMRARFDYDLASRALKLDYHARIGKMDAPAMNGLLTNLVGVRVKQGTIDSASFDIDVRDRVASGTMRLLYHELDFEMVDKQTHDRGLGERFATFMQNRKAHASNPRDEDEPAVVIELRRERAPSVSLIKFVWETVREGALRTVGVQKSQR